MAAAITQANLSLVEDAAASYKRAAELGPREPKVYYNYSVLLRQLRRVDEARNALDHALELAPDSVLFRVARAGAEVSWTGDVARAKAILDGLPAGRDPDGRATASRCNLALFERDFSGALRILEAYPGETLPAVAGGWGQAPRAISEGIIRLYAGDYVRAYEYFDSVRWQFEEATRVQPDSIAAHGDLAMLYAVMGWREPALAEALRTKELEAAAKIPPSRRVNWAELYAWLGELDQAWPELERLIVGPSGVSLNNLRLDPGFDPLRKDPRFQKLLETKKL
jgi:tetratricopeptide (TPR) repeat protein